MSSIPPTGARELARGYFAPLRARGYLHEFERLERSSWIVGAAVGLCALAVMIATALPLLVA